MTEKEALTLLREGQEIGLRWMIERYASYVGSIVWSILSQALTVQDAEEVAADVFMVLWQYRDRPMEGRVKGYLASIARSRAIDRLRTVRQSQPLEYDVLEMITDGPEGEVILRERQRQLRALLEAMGPPDREIFLRHYYLHETANHIGKRLGMTPEAVRQRLKRGRDLLRRQIEKGDM